MNSLKSREYCRQKIKAMLEEAEFRSEKFLHLAANENVISRTCRLAENSSLSSRYLIGSHSDLDTRDLIAQRGFLLSKFDSIKELLFMADSAARKLFSAEFVEFRALSGLNAVVLSILSLTQPGDVVWCLSQHCGGHFSTCGLLKSLGRFPVEILWDEVSMQYDLLSMQDQLKIKKPSAVLVDYADPLQSFPISSLREVLGGEAIIIYDASHVLGLIAGGAFQLPFSEGADCIIGSTHKTFPGPQKALMLFRSRTLGEKVASRITKYLLSSQHTHHTLALCVALLEMEFFAEAYANSIIDNAKTLAKELESYGVNLLVPSSLQCTHSLYFSWPGFSSTKAVELLSDNRITTTLRHVYGGEYVRMGVQELTRRGMKQSEMRVIAKCIASVFCQDITCSSNEIDSLIVGFNNCHYSFDDF